MRFVTLLAFALLANTVFGQTITVEQIEATLAKSVKVEQLADSVAVIFTEKLGVKTGAYLQVESKAKWATPLLDGVNISPTQKPGQWIMFSAPGKYRMLLAEFDPDTGPRYTYHDLIIGAPQKPDDPVLPPPSGDYAALVKVAKEGADKLNDPTTRKALAAAYKSAVESSAGKSYDDAHMAITAARFAVMNARKGASRLVDWASWLKAVDMELLKAVRLGEVSDYLAAVAAIAKAIE